MIKISRVAWRVSNINVALSQVVQKCYSFYCPIWASRISAAWPTAMVLTILLWSGPDNCCSLISLSKDGLSNGGLAVIDKLPSFLSVGMQYNSNQFHLILQQYSIASRGCRTFSTKRFPFVEIVNAPENVHVLLQTEPCISNPMYHQHFPGTLVYRLDFWMIYFLFPFAFIDIAYETTVEFSQLNCRSGFKMECSLCILTIVPAQECLHRINNGNRSVVVFVPTADKPLYRKNMFFKGQ